MITERQKRVIKLILSIDNGIYAKKLAEKLKVSTRTIRNDILAINMELTYCECSIQSSKQKGYFIKEQDKNIIWDYLKETDVSDGLQIASTPMQRKYYMLGLLMKKNKRSLGELSDILYVSEQTIYKDMISFIIFLKQKYRFHALKLENGYLSLSTDEITLRTLFYRIAKEEIYMSNNIMNVHLFQVIKNDIRLTDLTNLEDYLSQYCKSNDIILSDQLLYIVSWMILFTGIRVKQGNQITRKVEVLHKNEVLDQMMVDINNIFHCNLGKYDCNLLVNYIETLGFYKNNIDMIDLSETDDVLAQYLNLLKDKYNYELMSIPTMYDNFRIHLQFAIKRLLVDYQLKNPLLYEVKTKHAFAYELAMLIVPIIHNKYGLYLSEDEVSFLTMYIIPILKYQNLTVKVLLVNGTSQTFANLLQVWLLQEFQTKIKVVGKVTLHQLQKDIHKYHCDLVISDVVIDCKIDIPYILIQHLPGSSHKMQIEAFLKNYGMVSATKEIYHKIFSNKNILFIEEETTFEEVISKCCQLLQLHNHIENGEEFKNKILEREEVYPTHIKNGVFFPHPLENIALVNGICLAIMKQNLYKDDQSVKLIFVSAQEAMLNHDMTHIYNLVYKIARSKDLIEILRTMDDEDDVMMYLKRIIQIM